MVKIGLENASMMTLKSNNNDKVIVHRSNFNNELPHDTFCTKNKTKSKLSFGINSTTEHRMVMTNIAIATATGVGGILAPLFGTTMENVYMVGYPLLLLSSFITGIRLFILDK